MLLDGELSGNKHGAAYLRHENKVQFGIDTETLELRTIEVTKNKTGDATMLPELLNQISVICGD